MVNTYQNITGTFTDVSQELVAVASRLRLSNIQVRQRRYGIGSGVIWRSDGLIITNAHVATNSQAIVELSDGRLMDAVRIAYDPKIDLAALKVNATNLPAVTIADSDVLRVGELVLAMGNPLGQVGVLTTGIIHAVNPTSSRDTSHHALEQEGFSHPLAKNWVMADVRLAPGNSGGVLADAGGRAIGINTMIAGGLALAIPSNTVERFLRESVERPYIGVTMRPVMVPLRHKNVLGLLVLEVAFGSLAQAALLSKGDVLIGIFGQYFQSPDDFLSVIKHAQPGDVLPIEFIRQGKIHHCTVVMEEQKFNPLKSPFIGAKAA